MVDASSREPNVGQVLLLMNGFVQRELVNNSNAQLYRSLEGTTTDKGKSVASMSPSSTAHRLLMKCYGC